MKKHPIFQTKRWVPETLNNETSWFEVRSFQSLLPSFTGLNNHSIGLDVQEEHVEKWPTFWADVQFNDAWLSP